MDSVLECYFCKDTFTSQKELNNHINDNFMDKSHHFCNCGICLLSRYISFSVMKLYNKLKN